jgi:hypothetical protein
MLTLTTLTAEPQAVEPLVRKLASSGDCLIVVLNVEGAQIREGGNPPAPGASTDRRRECRLQLVACEERHQCLLLRWEGAVRRATPSPGPSTRQAVLEGRSTP